MVRTSVKSSVLLCSYHVLTSSVSYQSTHARPNGIFFFNNSNYKYPQRYAKTTEINSFGLVNIMRLQGFCNSKHIQNDDDDEIKTSDIQKYTVYYILFNKLSLCPYMVRKPSKSVIRTCQISCDIRKSPYLEVQCRFSFIACLAAILKSEAVLAVFSGNFNSLEETFHD